jgi:hypothetical protein
MLVRGKSLKGLADLQSFIYLGATIGFLVACSSKPPNCVNEIRSETISPNREQRAVVFLRTCSKSGLTTTNVSILRPGERLPDGNGNVMGYDHPISIRTIWKDDARLTVFSYADLSKSTRREQVGRIAVDYSQIMETDLVMPPVESK